MAKDAIPADDLIAIPDDEIQLGFDKDGLPKAEATGTVARGKPIEEEAPDPAIKALERERDEAKADADRNARDAAAERARATEALALADQRGQALDKRTGEAVGAHRAAVRERYDRVAREHETVASGINTANSMLAQAQKDLEAAITTGDGARTAELTAHVGKITAQLSQLEGLKPNVEAYLNEAKQSYEDTERQVAEAARRRAETPAQDVEKPKGPKDFNDFASNYADDWIDKSPRAAQSWLREHKSEVLKDPTKFEHLNTFARLYALKNGEGSLNSKGFVRALDGEFFPKQDTEEELEVVDDNEPDEAAAETPKAKPKAKATPAAPVSRGNTVFNSNNLNADKIWLEPKLKAELVRMNLDPTKWALEARDLIKQGKLPKEYLDPGYDRGF